MASWAPAPTARTPQSAVASDGSAAFSQCTPPTPPRLPCLPGPAHGQYAIKTMILSSHLRSHQLEGLRRRSSFDAWLRLLGRTPGPGSCPTPTPTLLKPCLTSAGETACIGGRAPLEATSTQLRLRPSVCLNLAGPVGNPPLQPSRDNLTHVHKVNVHLSSEGGRAAACRSSRDLQVPSLILEAEQDELRSDPLTWKSLDVSTGGTVGC